MDASKPNSLGDVNIKQFLQKIYHYKFSFLASLIICLGIAYFYLKIAVPQYEVSTSLLIETSGKDRQLGDSKYIQGGVGVFDAEKNLYNEIAILKSYTLILQAIKELDFNVAYFSGSTWKQQALYGDEPIKIVTVKNAPQVQGAKFQVKILDQNRFQLILDIDEFSTYNETTNNSTLYEESLTYDRVHTFGEEIAHRFFKFTIEKNELNPLDNFEGQDLFFELHNNDGLANNYFEKLEVSQVDIQASILTLTVAGNNAPKEIAFLQALSKAFINRKLFERDEIAAGKERFIRAQLQSITDSLAIAERQLENFKRGANAVDLTRSASNALDQLQTLENQKGQISLNIKYYKSLLEYINNNDKIDKIVAPSVAGINDPLLSENLLELKRLHSEKTKLAFYKGAKSYDLVLVNEQIANTTNALKENVRNLINTANIQLKDRNQRIAQFESTINQLPVNEKKLLNFQRESTLYGNMYNYLNQELAKTGIAKAEDISDTKVVDPPRQIGDGPVAPQKMLIMLLAAILSTFLPLGMILFSDSSKDKIQNRLQLEGFQKIPLLAEVGSFDTSLSTLANYKSVWEKEETFRNLSATLQFRITDQENNVIGVTSASKGEGKTFCALNLAVNYAKAGKKTLLIDLNFRNPVLGRGLTLQDTHDLWNYLIDPACTVDQITHKHQNIVNLSYIVTKKAERNPHLFLANHRLHTLISALKYEYDYIILDTPAIGLVSDYLLIARHTDINLFICRKGISKLHQLEEIASLINKGVMKNPMLVFNDSGAKMTLAKQYNSNNEAIEKKLIKWLPSFRRSVS